MELLNEVRPIKRYAHRSSDHKGEGQSRPHSPLGQRQEIDAGIEPGAVAAPAPSRRRLRTSKSPRALSPTRLALRTKSASPTPDISPNNSSEDQSKVLRSLIADIKVKEVEVERLGAIHVAMGAFGEVWKGFLLPSRTQLVAIKIPRVVTNVVKLQKRLKRELKSWSLLEHENVLPLLGVVIAPEAGQLWLVSPWMEKSNLRDYMQCHPEADALHMLIGVARGLKYVHSQGIVHGDLKANNVLVDDQGQPRLMDFGLSFDQEELNKVQTTSSMFYGNCRWLAPERLNPTEFNLRPAEARSTSSDVYAFGMVIYEVFSGEVPFYEIPNSMFIPGHVLDGKRPKPLEDVARPGFNGRLWSLLSDCWLGNPRERPSVQAVEVALQAVSSETEGMRSHYEKMTKRALEAEADCQALKAELEGALDREDQSEATLREVNKDYEVVLGQLETAESELRRTSQDLEEADVRETILRAQLDASEQLRDELMRSMVEREAAQRRQLDEANESLERMRMELESKYRELSACQSLFSKMKDTTDGLSVDLYPSVQFFPDPPSGHFIDRVGELNSAILNFSNQLTTQANHCPNAKAIQGAICETLYVEVLQETVLYFGAEDSDSDIPPEVQETIADSSEAHRQWRLMTRRHLKVRRKAEDVQPAKQKLVRQVFRNINDKTYGTRTLLDSDTRFRDLMEALCGRCIELAHDLGCNSTDLRILYFAYETAFDDTRMDLGVHCDQLATVLRTEQFGFATHPATMHIKAVVTCRQSPRPRPLTWP